MFKIRVRGVVQGVGFRPYVYNNAKKLGICGYVQNTAEGIKIICDNKELILKILKNPPSLAKIESIKVNKITNLTKYLDFKILESEKTNSYTAIPTDLNLCEDCLKELFDKNNSRYNHPFISCTNCGPRYSVIESTPYDREKTSFKVFDMCELCLNEFKDQQNRRYHAQIIACLKCGPELKLYKNLKKIKIENPILKLTKLINDGEVVAIKGVGGFHLVCNIKSVDKLKKITKRHHKPFALMGSDINMIKKFCLVNLVENENLKSQIRPIVLLEKKKKNSLLDISELSSLGFMLPYTPIHYLIFEHISEPLIFTSSNLPSQPITKTKEEQFVEYVLDYNRVIVNSVDDSIIKIIDNKPLIIRRSRGYTPNEITITPNYRNSCSNMLSVGAELKNIFCIKKKSKLILSQHIGNTYNLETFENFKQRIKKLINFTQSNPELILKDKNYSFNTSLFANEFSSNNNIEIFEVQHHIAHAFSVAIEHNLNNFLGIICDGGGLGNDEKIWGGEVFHNDKRIGHLEYQSLVGGDIANKEPIRMLVGILSKIMSIKNIIKLLNKNNSLEIKIYYKQKKENFNCIETSSCGRVLDCVAVLLGFSNINFYEGRGAMLLESNSSRKVKMYIEPIIENNILMTTPLFEFIVKNLNIISREELGRFTQVYLAKGLLKIAKNYNSKLPVIFGGGCAYNFIMTSFMMKNNILLNKKVPCGDGGVSTGQIAYYLWWLKNNSTKQNNTNNHITTKTKTN